MNSNQPYIPRINEDPAGMQKLRGSMLVDFKIWWREIDRVLLGLILLLMMISAVAVAAASPASAHRLSTSTVTLPDLYFYWAHLRWQFVGLVCLLGASALPLDMARRLGVAISAGMVLMLFLVPLIGFEVNGAKRWINLGLSFQPSEFLKTGFAIALAWLMTWRLRDPNLPVTAIACAAMALIGGLLMIQPNLGATILFSGVWCVIILLSGVSIQRLLQIFAAALGLLTLAYFFYGNAANRINAFFFGGTAYDQVDLAQRTLQAGGWTGSGMWLGERKMSLPEAHTDYIFSVIGEEFGLLACVIIMALYLAIALRVFTRLVSEENLFVMLAGAGLATQICGQAFINILVNLQLFPSKGMTLPLISYGGSSTIALCLACGLLLAITRRNPYLMREAPGLRGLVDRFVPGSERARE